MRGEEKEVDGFELARTESLETFEKQDEHELPDLIAEVSDAELQHRDSVIAAVRALLAGDEVHLDELELPERELVALDFMHAAIAGKDRRWSTFVYADDRRSMLEQALAVLEPVLDAGQAQELVDVTAKVAELRASLTNLEDAQDELLIDEEVVAKAETASGDKPADAAAATTLTGPDVPAKPPAATTLTGPDVPAKPPAATTLTGPDVPGKPPAPTTLLGPELPAKPPPASTLYGPDVPGKPVAKTTLDGPELPASRPTASTVYDADTPVVPTPRAIRGSDDDPEPATPDGDGDGEKKKSWWRRPFG